MVVAVLVTVELAQMVIEAEMHTFLIGQVASDVVAGNRDLAVLHVLGVHEQHLLDHIHFTEQDRTDQTVKIASGDQAEFLLAHDPAIRGLASGILGGQVGHVRRYPLKLVGLRFPDP